MEGKKVLHVGVVGSGAISDIYLTNMINRFDNLQVDKICSAHFENASAKAEKYGIRACTYEDMLDDPSIDMIVNLTPVGAHYKIIKKALFAGKHVYTEKTLTDDLAKAGKLLKLADEKGLYLGSAPDTFLGAALQTAREFIDSGKLGEVNSFAAAINRNNSVLMSMFSFLLEPGCGVCYDYLVYYVTALVSLLGPVDQVAAFTRNPYPVRIHKWPESPKLGEEMHSSNESHVSAIMRLENGVTGTIQMDADSVMEDQAFFAVYGTKGILYLADPNRFGNPVYFLPEGGEKEEVPFTHGFADNSRGIGPSEMADAILSGRKNRTAKELAYHVMEVLHGILKSSETLEFVTIESTCTRPEPMGK